MDQPKTKGITIRIKRTKKTDQPQDLNQELTKEEPKKGININIRRTKKNNPQLETKTAQQVETEKEVKTKCPTCGFDVEVKKEKKEKKEKTDKDEIVDKQTSCKLCNISLLMSEFKEHKNNVSHTRRQEIVKMLPKLTDEDVIKFLNSI